MSAGSLNESMDQGAPLGSLKILGPRSWLNTRGCRTETGVCFCAPNVSISSVTENADPMSYLGLKAPQAEYQGVAWQNRMTAFAHQRI
eukprot:1156014-Pelagomonas_calceolata.AAC.13